MTIRKLELNGRTLDKLYVGGDFVIPSFNVETEIENVKGRVGGLKRRRNLNHYSFEMTLIYRNRDNSMTAKEISDDVVRFINHEDEVDIRLTDQDWFWKGYVDGPIEVPTLVNGYAEMAVTIVLADPYKYSSAIYENTAISDSVDIVNEGTAEADLIINARALENSTMYMIADEKDDYFMVGKPVDAFSEEADTTPAVWRVRGYNINTFTKVTDGTWVGDSNLTGQYSNGSLSVRGNSISGNYGDQDYTSQSWYGPVYRKSLDNLVDDFHTRCGFTLHQTEGYGVGKAFVHLYDEEGNRVLSYGLIDAMNRGSSVRAVVRLYTSDGGYEEIYNSTGYRYDTVYADRFIWISVDRKGNEWKIKTWHNYTENGIKKVTARANIFYTDGNGLFDRKIAIAEIALGRHVKYREAETRLSWAIVEDRLELENVVPYLIKKGDEILIDTKQSLVLLNDEPITEHKDFGSNYIKVDEGLSTLLIEPVGRFDTTVRWYDKFL